MVSNRTQSGSPGARTRLGNKRELILDKAAETLAERGFDATTMRDIASRVGILPGSIYYHFPSKEDLLVAVYTEGVARIRRNVEASIASLSDPWQRITAACAAHLRTLLDSSSFATVLARPIPAGRADLRQRLVQGRDEYESILHGLLEELPLKESVSPLLLRHMLISALNGVPWWYSGQGALSPDEIAVGYVHMLRDPICRH